MKFQSSVVVSVLALSLNPSCAFVPSKTSGRPSLPVVNSMAMAEETKMTEETTMKDGLTIDMISKLGFRDVQKELARRELETSGTLSAMRDRLRHDTGHTRIATPQKGGSAAAMDEESLTQAFAQTGIDFQDNSDPDFEFNDLIRETLERAERNHWKGATRKLKTLSRRFGESSADPRTIPQDVYMSVLRSCMEDQLNGARAAEPARKIMERMVEAGYKIPDDVANYCIKNSLDDGPDGTHDGFGGVDTALAMLAAIESSNSPPLLNEDTYSKLIFLLATNGSLDASLQLLRLVVVEKSLTPTLQLFADVATACVSGKGEEDPEKVMTVMAYAKAAGYELDNIASTVDGRSLLAAGVIAAEKLDNIGLGLRFLTAASKAQGCEPDRGDDLVATSSPAAQRACTILHRQAIRKASGEDNSWKIAVRLLELMLERGLTPSPSTWRNVVTCCAKSKKSRKATALLLDWSELAKQGRAEKPPLRVFNTVVNACEVCGEEELTVQVLDAMKETQSTEGNLITFNIALKRLAKQGNVPACEGIIIGMLQSGIEPSVVTYTTAIAACVQKPKHSELAIEWMKRMRSRKVQPNVITYNTAFASCLDGTLEGSARASILASELVADIEKQVNSGILEIDEYTNIIPNYYTRGLARDVMKQLKDNWENDLIDKKVAKSTLRVPLLQLVQYLKTDLAAKAEKQQRFIKKEESPDEDADEELDYSTAISTHRAAAV